MISVNVEKAFDENQHSFMVKKKIFQKVGIEGTYLILICDIYNNPQLTYTQW